LKVSALKSLEL